MGRNHCLYALLVASTLLGGCAAAPVALGAAGGVAAFKYLENQQVREYPRPLGEVFDATLAALRDLDYPPPALALPEHQEAKVQSGDAAIAMAQFPGGVTRVAVRIETFHTANHERQANLILEAIGKRLAAPSTVAPASDNLAQR